MNHLKQLAYHVIQFNGRPVLFIGLLFGAIPFAIVPEYWYIHFPACVIGCFCAELVIAQRKFKKTGKY